MTGRRTDAGVTGTAAPPALDLARDRALARRMLRGEERAMREFCAAYLPRLYAFALRRVASPADADDVVQSVLCIAARRIETFRGDATLYSWLLAICRREAGRHAAAVRRRSELECGDEAAIEELEAADGTAPEKVSSRHQRAARVWESLDRLPERYARALELKYMDGHSSREIAAMFAMSDEAVQSLLARARRTFREVCDHELREEMDRENGG